MRSRLAKIVMPIIMSMGVMVALPLTAGASGNVLIVSQSITFTSTAPSYPTVGSTYTATATGGASGNPITFIKDPTSTSGCTVSTGGVVTFTTPAGTCIIDANQLGNASYAVATQVQQTITEVLIPQAINFTSTPQLKVPVNGTFTVTATGGLSTNPVTFTKDLSSTSGCTVSPTGLVTMSAPVGTCIVNANQLGNASYAAATMKQYATVSSSLLPQRVTAAVVPKSFVATAGTAYRVVARGGASGNTLIFSKVPTSKSGCVVNQITGVVTFRAPFGSCIVSINQPGSTTYAIATPARRVFNVRPALRVSVSVVTLHYVNNSLALSPVFKRQLNAMALTIKQSGLQWVTLNGYTSSTGTAQQNDTLSTRQAMIAASYLKLRLAALKVKGVGFIISGHGATMFVVHSTTSIRNRRTEIIAKK